MSSGSYRFVSLSTLAVEYAFADVHDELAPVSKLPTVPAPAARASTVPTVPVPAVEPAASAAKARR